jgi:hypothetical protein
VFDEESIYDIPLHASGGGSTWSNISAFSGATLTNTSNVWTATVAGYGNLGLSTSNLAASTDGSVRVRYTATDGVDAVIGFNTSNATSGVGSMPFALWVSSGGGNDIYVRQGGAPISTGIDAAAGDYLRINRTGSVWKAQKSVDGTTWTDLYTYSSTSTAQVWVVCDINGTGGKMYDPEGENLTP